MSRPTREETYMEIAEVISRRGTCQRAQVGCVITKDNRIVATGYNGPVTGLNCDIMHCMMDRPCTHAVHAEANAIAFAAMDGISLRGSVLYCMTAPCKNCAMLIIQSGIVKVIYKNSYRTTEGMGILAKVGIVTISMNELKELTNYGSSHAI